MTPTPSIAELAKAAELVKRLRERCKHSPFTLPIEEEAAQVILSLTTRLENAEAALRPFAEFFKSEKHDLSPANDATIVATFLEQGTGLPLAELFISDFRHAAAIEALSDMSDLAVKS